jgi:C4-dicarboxylate-specific signal transduction histidine kinase
MALEQSDLSTIADLVAQQVQAGLADVKTELSKVESTPVVKKAEADLKEYWVHLADGQTLKMAESELSSHVGGIAVVAKYLVGA